MKVAHGIATEKLVLLKHQPCRIYLGIGRREVPVPKQGHLLLQGPIRLHHAVEPPYLQVGDVVLGKNVVKLSILHGLEGIGAKHLVVVDELVYGGVKTLFQAAEHRFAVGSETRSAQQMRHSLIILRMYLCTHISSPISPERLAL